MHLCGCAGLGQIDLAGRHGGLAQRELLPVTSSRWKTRSSLCIHKTAWSPQREVGLDTDSWEAALANTLRQAPDMILMAKSGDRGPWNMPWPFAETDTCAPGHPGTPTAPTRPWTGSSSPKLLRAQLLMDLSLNRLRGMISQRLIPAGWRGRGWAEAMLQHPAHCRPGSLQGAKWPEIKGIMPERAATWAQTRRPVAVRFV